MMVSRRCPALFIAAPASGQGKTSVTAALARRYRDAGRRVRVFKTGPDFLDPMILERASGQPVYQLDLWMCGERHCRQLLYEAAGQADVILIEGAMGLFDGDRSGADLATLFGIPVLAVIDGGAMAQTFGAVALGLASYRQDLPFAGVLANRVAGERHYQMLVESLPAGMASFGWLANTPDIALPERHLGLKQAAEIEDLDTRIARAAETLNQTHDALPPPVELTAAEAGTVDPLLSGVRIGVARDEAFMFLYPANLQLLRQLGAELLFFSPLHDQLPPPADAFYFPGGYPELHLDRLGSNQPMKAKLRSYYQEDRPMLAECGGMLYLLESLTDTGGRQAEMVGLLPGHASLQARLANLGLHGVELQGGCLRGHTFHYSSLSSPLSPVAVSQPSRRGQRGEPVYRERRLLASYLHLYFPSNPPAAARLFLP